MKLQATEIRIGNKVDLYGTTATVCEADFCDKTHGIAITAGKPIPLTEEWVLKLGFELIGSCLELNKVALNPNMTTQANEAWIVSKIPEQGISGTRTFLTYVQHVHQLQNLYHALTGEELTT